MARLQDNSRPMSPTKMETKRKLQQFTVSGSLDNKRGGGGGGGGGDSGSEKIKM